MNTPTPESSALGRRALLGAAGAGLVLPAVARRARAADPVQLTIWAWVPHMQMEIDLFEAANPGIKVNLVNAGQGGPQYVKLRTAIKAGTGAPDVAQIEFDMLPTFRQVEALADLAPYGANEHAGDFIDWSWQQVSDGNQVYAMPWDSGPLGLVYREDILEQVGAKPAETWDEFAEPGDEAAQGPSRPVPDQRHVQRGRVVDGGCCGRPAGDPFHVDGDTIGIASTTRGEALAACWQKLIDAKAVDTRPGFMTEWYRRSTAAATRSGSRCLGTGVPLPVREEQRGQVARGADSAMGAGQNVSANWAARPRDHDADQAPEGSGGVRDWLRTRSSALMFANKQFLFPVLESLLKDKASATRLSVLRRPDDQPGLRREPRRRSNADFQVEPVQGLFAAQNGNEWARRRPATARSLEGASTRLQAQRRPLRAPAGLHGHDLMDPTSTIPHPPRRRGARGPARGPRPYSSCRRS